MFEIKNIIKGILDLIYPRSIYCISCQSIIDKTRSYSICDSCIRRINWANGKTCVKCGKVIEGEWQNDLCADCMDFAHYFDKAITCSEYGLYTRKIIFDLKYNGKAYIAESIADAMGDKLNVSDLEYDIIVPVPVSKGKLKERGFNQAYLIATKLAKIVNKPCLTVLHRSKETSAQRGLGRIDRYENLRDAFAIKKGFEDKVKDKKVLIVDDIYTTGATLDECSKVLKENGAKFVYGISFAAGGNRHNIDLE